MTEIQDPFSIELDADTHNLLEEVDTLLNLINKRRPFTPETQHKLATAFLPDRVTASLNMEGITVTRRQTLAMMDAMTLSENTSKAEQELLNALKADEYVYDIAIENHPVSENVVREINSLILEGVDGRGGVYRSEMVEISGASYQPPNPGDVPDLIQELIKVYETTSSINPILRAVWLHAQFTHIHPFVDGNGRTGRLLQDFSLLSDKLFPTGIPSAHRDNYYEALELSDDGQWNKIVQMVSNFQLNICSKVQALLDEEKQRASFLQRIAKSARDEKAGTLHKQYLVWSRRMKQFADSMVTQSDELNELSDELHIQSELFDLIDFQKWKQISEKGSDTQTWLLRQNWYHDGDLFFRSIMYFRRHEFTPFDQMDRDALYGTVALQLTGGQPPFIERFDFSGGFSDRELRFRQLLWANDKLCVFKYNGETWVDKFDNERGKWSCEEVLSTSEITQQIFEDMFGRKLGLNL